jgi:hypothetical protein
MKMRTKIFLFASLIFFCILPYLISWLLLDDVGNKNLGDEYYNNHTYRTATPEEFASGDSSLVRKNIAYFFRKQKLTNNGLLISDDRGNFILFKEKDGYVLAKYRMPNGEPGEQTIKYSETTTINVRGYGIMVVLISKSGAIEIAAVKKQKK